MIAGGKEVFFFPPGRVTLKVELRKVLEFFRLPLQTVGLRIVARVTVLSLEASKKEE